MHEKKKNEEKAKEDIDKRVKEAKHKAIEDNKKKALESGNKLTQTLNSEGNLLKKTSFFSFEEFDEYFNFSATFVTNMVARILDMNKSQAETFKKLFIAGEVLDFLRKSFLQGYFLADTAKKLFDYFWSNYSKSLIVNTQSLKLLSSDNKLMFLSFNHLFLALAQKITTRPNAIFTGEVHLTWQEILPIIYKIDKLV